MEDNIKIIQDKKNIDEEKLLNLITNKNIFNNKKTKFKYQKDFEFIINISKNLEENEFINFYNYLNQINIPILKILVNGFIEFDLENEIDDILILELISKGINIFFSKNLFCFIYKKLSKKFRKHNFLNNARAINSFEKLFKVWKLLYNTENSFNNSNLFYSSGFIIFPKIIEDNKFIEIDFNDKNEMKNMTVSIIFKSSMVLNLNKNNNNFSFVRLYDDKNEIFEFKYNEIYLINDEVNTSFSKIFKIKFDFSQKSYDIFINKKRKISQKEEQKCNFNLIKKLVIFNNFYVEISSITIKKNYSIIANYVESSSFVDPLKIKINKKTLNNLLQIKTNALGLPIKEEEENNNNKNEKLYLYQYCGAFISIKINYKKAENNEISKKQIINLSEIEYIGGLNCFIPLLKIIKYIIDNLDTNAKTKNIQDEKEKLVTLSDINIYIDKCFMWIKDILKIILKMVCLSEKNYKSLIKIIVPLIGSLAEISHSLNNLCESKLIPSDKISLLFKDEIFSTFYVLILINSFPYNIKRLFGKIIGINKNLDNLNISMDSIIFDIGKNKIKNLDWYFIILVIYIEFILIYFNSSQKVPFKLINQISLSFLSNNENDKNMIKKQMAIKILSNVIQNLCNVNDNTNNLDYILQDKIFLNDNNFFFQFIIYMLTSFLNIKFLLKISQIQINNNSFFFKFIDFFENYFGNKDKINITNDYVQMIINFKYYPEEITFLQKFFPFLDKSKFYSENELIMEELIDYHSEYHHLMKELFIFNKFWSNQKLFFHKSLDTIKKSKLKYKNINYYTRNFQRPIIYPSLDYKHRYPEFTHFEINKDLYLLEEDNDDYNFDLDCPELDDLIEEYDKSIFEIIEKNGKINVCQVCLVKQTHHVKGNLFVFYENDKILIYFYSYSYNLQNNEDEILCCNKGNEEETEQNEINPKSNEGNNLCYGSIFKCPKKDAHKKIKIDLNDIRLVLLRIYFYRNSALEIFTETKSYFFNFFSEYKRNSFMCAFTYPCQNSYFPININDNLIGYMKMNPKIIKKNKFTDIIDKKNNFIEFISDQTSKGNLCEMCIFDIIMIINLISNRSYNDLYNYPVFPILYLCDKQKHTVVIRDFKEHIGFQENSEKSKIRKALFLKSYKENINEFNENNYNVKNTLKVKDSIYYFNTHYSNNIYTSNFLIRLFPYSFLAIELQGSGFDTPNRLFYSLENTFSNISAQKSDLRELIPEFFYLPEMFMNINSINFGKKGTNESVDDVIMPKSLANKNINIFDKIKNNESDENDMKKNNYKKYFIFIEDMKNRLESLTKELSSWLNIVFGPNQKYSPNKEIYFRPESYINCKEKNDNYLNNNIIMASTEFGIIPLQTIFDNKILNNLKKRKSNKYEKFKKYGNKEMNKYSSSKKLITIKKEIKDNEKKEFFSDIEEYNFTKNDKKMDEKYFKNKFNDYWDEELNIDFKINNNNNLGKLEIYKEENLINEIFDHNDIIIDFFYNKRLNMFSTTSYDGFICTYIFPNKLFSMIKHPKLRFYDKVFLSSNPFPMIIGYESNGNILTTFSLSGIVINGVKIKTEKKINEIEIKPIFNMYGGAFKDRIKITIKSDKKIYNEFYNLPYFDLEYKEIINN